MPTIGVVEKSGGDDGVPFSFSVPILCAGGRLFFGGSHAVTHTLRTLCTLVSFSLSVVNLCVRQCIERIFGGV